MASAISRVTVTWDEHTRRWLDGERALSAAFTEWWSAYRGKGHGEPTQEALAEPYIGTWERPRLVTLGLNPGVADFDLQGAQGRFSDRIRELGSYRRWAASAPYGPGGEWEVAHGRNRYNHARLEFASRWTGPPLATAGDMLVVELFPWHSKRVTAAITPPPEILDEFVWQPLSELSLTKIFAFGAPWRRVCDQLGLECTRRLGAGGEDFGSRVRSRAVLIYRAPSGQDIVVISQQGYAGPPGPEDTERLRELLTP